MKLAWIAATLLTTLGCEKVPSKLDKVTAGATPEAAGPASGDLETRVARLEKKLAKLDVPPQGEPEDALEFLALAYESRMQQEAKPQPGKIYGVDITQNIQLGHVDGAPDALVTIVEAWDFA